MDKKLGFDYTVEYCYPHWPKINAVLNDQAMQELGYQIMLQLQDGKYHTIQIVRTVDFQDLRSHVHFRVNLWDVNTHRITVPVYENMDMFTLSVTATQELYNRITYNIIYNIERIKNAFFSMLYGRNSYITKK